MLCIHHAVILSHLLSFAMYDLPGCKLLWQRLSLFVCCHLLHLLAFVYLLIFDAEYLAVTTNETITNSTWVDTTDGSALDAEHSGLYIYGGNVSTELVVDSGSEEVALKRVYFFVDYHFFFFLFFFFFFLLRWDDKVGSRPLICILLPVWCCKVQERCLLVESPAVAVHFLLDLASSFCFLALTSVFSVCASPLPNLHVIISSFHLHD